MRNYLKVKYGYTLALLLLPLVSSAQTLDTILDKVQELIQMAVPIVVGFAVLFFLYGVIKYLIAKDPEAQKEARSVMIYGIIVLFVMVSIWGLVRVLAETFDITASGAHNVTPLVPVN